jgi:hypothetical protein
MKITQLKIRKMGFSPRATIAFKNKAKYSRKNKHKNKSNE